MKLVRQLFVFLILLAALSACNLNTSIESINGPDEALVNLSIETAGDNSGEKVTEVTMAPTQTYSLYAIKRDSQGNFQENIIGKWSLVGDIGDLTIFSGGKFATFTATQTGTGYISVELEGQSLVVNINVISTNAPIAVTDSYSTGSDVAIDVLDVMSNDYDTDGDDFTLVSFTQPTNGTVTDNGDGTLKYTPSASYFGEDSFTYTIDDGLNGTNTGTVNVSIYSYFSWTGAVDSNFSTNGNWCGNWVSGSCEGATSSPGSADIAHFTGGCTTCDVTLSSNINVSGIQIDSIYPGTFTQSTGRQITVGASHWKQYGGAFIGGDSNITVNKSIYIYGGSFKSTSATLSVKNNVTVDSSVSFDANSGLLYMNGSGSGDGTLNAPGIEFNRVTLGKSHSQFYVSGSEPIVKGKLILQMGGGGNGQFRSGTLCANGDVDIISQTTSSNMNGKIKICGTGNQTINGLGGVAGHLEIASTGGTVFFVGTIDVGKSFTYTSGVVDAGSSTFRMVGNGTGDGPIDAAGMEFNNLYVGKAFACPSVVGTANVKGNLTISNSTGCKLSGGEINLEGNFLMTSNNSGGNTKINFVGSNAQTINITGGSLPTGMVTIDKSAGSTLQLLSSWNLSASGQDLLLNSGTLDLNANALTVNDYFTIESAGVLDVNSGNYSPNTLPKLINNGTINP